MKIDQQYKTYRELQKIHRSVTRMIFERYHYIFIKRYIKQNIKKISLLVSLLLIQIAIEISVLMFASGSLRSKAYVAFSQGYLSWLVGVVLTSVLVYLVISFFALKLERQIVIHFVNILRKSWYTLLLTGSERSITNQRKADFIAKISYHLPLVSMGIDNSALGIIRYLLLACILISVGSIGGLYTFLISSGVLLISVILGTVAYLIANYYISQEVASYSRVIKNIDNSLSELSSIKLLRQEYSSLEEFDLRVNTDTFFRIRRDIWLRYFNKIIYALVFVFSFIIVIIGLFYPEIFSRFSNGGNLFVLSILSVYSLRLIYEAGRTGLFIPPLRLGLLLSIPEHIPNDLKPNIQTPWSAIEFRSNKTKLHAESSYFKNIEVSIKKGERYLFIGLPYSGKTSLAELIAGKLRFNRNSWLAKIDEERLEYRRWIKKDIDSYYISTNLNSDRTIGELVLGKTKYEITEKDLSSVYDFAHRNPILSKLISRKRFVGESVRSYESNSEFIFAIHVLHCLLCKPDLVIIDNHWLDLNYSAINELIILMHRELCKSTIVVFSRENNDIIPYNNKYEIQKENIKGL